MFLIQPNVPILWCMYRKKEKIWIEKVTKCVLGVESLELNGYREIINKSLELNEYREIINKSLGLNEVEKLLWLNEVKNALE